MKLLLYFILCLSSCNRQQDDTSKLVYANDTYQMTLYFKDSIINKFELYSLKSKYTLTGKPEITLVDGEIPEGTNRIDYSNPEDKNGYECDIPYKYISQNLRLAFAVEKGNMKRLDLSIYYSKESQIEEGDHTLFNKNIKPSPLSTQK